MPDIHSPLFCRDPYIQMPKLASAAQEVASKTFLRIALGCWSVEYDIVTQG